MGMRLGNKDSSLDDTFMVQIQHRDGTWAFNDQGEWDSYESANEYGKYLFGPDCPHRVIKVSREVMEI